MKSTIVCVAAVLASGILFGDGAPLSRKVEAADELPSIVGIMQAGLRDAKWGIVSAVTEYRLASTGKVAGKTGVGSVLLVDKYQKADRGYDYVVRFRKRPAEGPYLVHASKLFALTGSFESLSDHQKKVYAEYYRLRAECDKIRQETNKRNGEMSPYYKDAIAAQKKFDSMSEEVIKLEGKLMNSAGTDAEKIRERLSQMKGEMNVQRGKLRELSMKHREWKKSHAAQLEDPEKDPRYKALRAEMNDYGQIIPGLVL